MAMPVCVGCQKLQKQVGKMWTMMSCLESDVQWHAKKVAEIQAEAKALEAALCKQKSEASVTEESESDSSSEEDAGGEMQEQLEDARRRSRKLRPRVVSMETESKSFAVAKDKAIKSRRIGQKHSDTLRKCKKRREQDMEKESFALERLSAGL